MRAHLWQKIHESVVMDLCQVFDQVRAGYLAPSLPSLPSLPPSHDGHLLTLHSNATALAPPSGRTEPRPRPPASR